MLQCLLLAWLVLALGAAELDPETKERLRNLAGKLSVPPGRLRDSMSPRTFVRSFMDIAQKQGKISSDDADFLAKYFFAKGQDRHKVQIDAAQGKENAGIKQIGAPPDGTQEGDASIENELSRVSAVNARLASGTAGPITKLLRSVVQRLGDTEKQSIRMARELEDHATAATSFFKLIGDPKTVAILKDFNDENLVGKLNRFMVEFMESRDTPSDTAQLTRVAKEHMKKQARFPTLKEFMNPDELFGTYRLDFRTSITALPNDRQIFGQLTENANTRELYRTINDRGKLLVQQGALPADLIISEPSSAGSGCRVPVNERTAGQVQLAIIHRCASGSPSQQDLKRSSLKLNEETKLIGCEGEKTAEGINTLECACSLIREGFVIEPFFNGVKIHRPEGLPMVGFDGSAQFQEYSFSPLEDTQLAQWKLRMRGGLTWFEETEEENCRLLWKGLRATHKQGLLYPTDFHLLCGHDGMEDCFSKLTTGRHG